MEDEQTARNLKVVQMLFLGCQLFQKMTGNSSIVKASRTAIFV